MGAYPGHYDMSISHVLTVYMHNDGLTYRLYVHML